MINKDQLSTQALALLDALKLHPKNEYRAIKLLQHILDPIYKKAHLNLEGKTIALHAIKADGFGDISHSYRMASKLEKAFPQTRIKLIFFCPAKGSGLSHSNQQEALVKSIFSSEHHHTVFFPKANAKGRRELSYNEQKAQERALDEDHDCLIGIAMPMANSALFHRRSFHEYGYGYHPRCLPLSNGPNIKHMQQMGMGLMDVETGLNFETPTEKTLEAIQTPWLHRQLNQGQPIYQLYFDNVLWEMQVIGLHMISRIEQRRSENMEAVNIICPLTHTLEDISSWGLLRLEEFRVADVARIVSIGPEGKIEILETGLSEGITLNLITAAIPREDMRIIEKHAEPFFGCTGDMSATAAISNNKLMFYKKNLSKDQFYKGFLDIVRKCNLPALSAFHATINGILDKSDSIIQSNTPKRRAGHCFKIEPNLDIQDPKSIMRESVPAIVDMIHKALPELESRYFATSLMQEVSTLNQYLLTHYDTTQRIIDAVYRDFVLSTYPALKAAEQEIMENYLDQINTLETRVENPSYQTINPGKILAFADQAQEKLSQAITQVVRNDANQKIHHTF